MSILFISEEGWILSHLAYINNVYNIVEDGGDCQTFRFNDALFKINSKFLRKNQIKSSNDELNLKSSKRKKRNLQNLLSEDILQQNNFVQEISRQILRSAIDQKLFESVIPDNNQESLLESKNFYINRLETNCNYFGSNEKDVAIVANFQNEKYIFPKNSKFYCFDIKDIHNKLSMRNQYDFILMDPAWWNKSIRRKRQKFEESSYKMIHNKDLASIPVKSLLSSNGIIAVWCTNSTSQIKSVLEEIFPAWNIVFKAKWYWLKVTQSGEPICDFNKVHGKQPYEQLIIGTVSSNALLSIPNKKVIISIPSAIHSHKPPLIEIFKCYLPQKPNCLEIFARYLLPEWTSWGFEVLKFQHISLYSTVNNKDTPTENDTDKH